MIEKIGAVILLIIGLFAYGKHKGKQEIKAKQNEKDIEQVKSSRKIKKDISKLSAIERAKHYSELLDNADG